MISIAHPYIGSEETDAVLQVLSSGQLAQGPRVRDFEKRFAEWVGSDYAIATSSGTTALHVALLAHDIKPGDEVITSTFSFIASANCILFAGASPVFADIESDFFTLDPTSIEDQITPRTKAIIPVHLYGQACAMEQISKIAQKYNLVIIEDACQAHGAKLSDKSMGSWGTACYSFYPTKNMTTIEGGMITTSDIKIAEAARLIRNHGSSQRYSHEILGFNFRMTDLQAAIGNVQLSRIDDFNKKRIENADYLNELLSGHDGLVVPKTRENALHVFHQYTVRLKGRQKVIQALQKRDIGFGIYYPLPIHCQPLYKGMGYQDVLPIAMKASEEVLSLPIHPGLTKDDLSLIAETVLSALL